MLNLDFDLLDDEDDEEVGSGYGMMMMNGMDQKKVNDEWQ
jgi:hypothetical protein